MPHIMIKALPKVVVTSIAVINSVRFIFVRLEYQDLINSINSLPVSILSIVLHMSIKIVYSNLLGEKSCKSVHLFNVVSVVGTVDTLVHLIRGHSQYGTNYWPAALCRKLSS